MVAYVNIGTYYLIGIPMGILLGWLFKLGVLVPMPLCYLISDQFKLNRENVSHLRPDHFFRETFNLQGIWAGMIGGTAVQTLILAIITIRCDWDKEVNKTINPSTQPKKTIKCRSDLKF